MNNNEDKPSLSHVVEMLTHMRAYITKALEGTPYAMIQLKAEHQLTGLINMIGALTGNTGTEAKPQNEFGAATNFMGDDVTVKAVVTPAILSVDDEMVNKIKEGVRQLEELYHTFANDTILKNFITNEDLLVLRALGKKCQIPDYADAVINTEFIQAIREVLEKKADVDQAKTPAPPVPDPEAEAAKAELIAQLEVDKTTIETAFKGKQDEIEKVNSDIVSAKNKFDDLNAKKAKKADIKTAGDAVEILIDLQENLLAEIGILNDQLAETNSQLIQAHNLLPHAEGTDQ